MTQSYNLSQFANNLNTAGQLDATDGLSGAVPPANGGTGQSTYTTGDILYASGATALAKLSDVATGNALISGGVGVAPSWGKVALTTHVSGTLPTANGGTNSTATPAAGSVLYGDGSAIVASAVGTSGQVLTSAGAGAPTWGVVQAAQNNATVFATAGSAQTFTIPAGVSRVKITVIGGGGAGGAGSTSGGGAETTGGGGGGGGTAIKWLAVSGAGAGGTLTVAVGAAGTGSSVTSGTSNTITAITGAAGSAGQAASGGSAGGSGGAGANGDLNITGGTGTRGGTSAATMGGSTFMAENSIAAGLRYGGGGGGATGSGGAVGAGAAGVVIFEY